MPKSNNSITSEKTVPKPYEINSYVKYDEFFDRFKIWETLKTERYLC